MGRFLEFEGKLRLEQLPSPGSLVYHAISGNTASLRLVPSTGGALITLHTALTLHALLIALSIPQPFLVNRGVSARSIVFLNNS